MNRLNSLIIVCLIAPICILGLCQEVHAKSDGILTDTFSGRISLTPPAAYFYSLWLGPTINAADFAICPSRSDGIYIAFSNEQSFMKWIQILDDGSTAGVGQFWNRYFDGSWINVEFFDLGSLVTLDSSDTLVTGGTIVCSQGGPPHAIGSRAHSISSLVSGLPNASIDWQVDRSFNLPWEYVAYNHRLAMLGTGDLVSLSDGEGGLVLAKFDVNGTLQESILYTIGDQILIGKGLYIGSGDKILIAGKNGFDLLIAAISSPDQYQACSINLTAIEQLTGASIAECADGSLIVAARSDTGMGTILMRLDPQLQEIIWTRKIWGVTPPENGIPFLDDSHFILCGADVAMVIMKWSIGGELDWSYQVSGLATINRVAACRTAAGRIAVVGFTPFTSLCILQTDSEGQYPDCPAVSPYSPPITIPRGVVSTNVMSSEIYGPGCSAGAWLRGGSMTVNPTVVCAPDPITPTPSPTDTPEPTFTPTLIPTVTSTPPLPTETPEPTHTSTQVPTATFTPPMPTETPTPAEPVEITPPALPSPTQTPDENDCEILGVSLWMPATAISPGDSVECRVSVCVTGNEPITDHPLFVILEFNGQYFFAPSFDSFDHYLSRYPEFHPGETIIQVIPAIIWPDTGGSTGSATWHSALINPEMNAIIGQMDSLPFSWTD